MNRQFISCLERFIEPMGLSDSKIIGVEPVPGGTINQATKITLQSGSQFFVKRNPFSIPGMFECEAHSLDVMRSTKTVRVPMSHGTGNALGAGNAPETTFLLLEWIDSAKRATDFFESLGRQLADLHQWNIGLRDYGFDHDNFIGNSTQPNPTFTSWSEFWAQHRIGHQLKLAANSGWHDSDLIRLGEKLVDRLDSLLAGPNEPPSLLHGDLWSGNLIADESGQPVLVDPACYFGSREAEFGMITLFGGFEQNFFDAYHEAWPMADGSDQRIELYRLYHLLNHLNLFGGSYLESCLAILRKYT
jgi:fructosamine-3-kinase